MSLVIDTAVQLYTTTYYNAFKHLFVSWCLLHCNFLSFFRLCNLVLLSLHCISFRCIIFVHVCCMMSNKVSVSVVVGLSVGPIIVTKIYLLRDYVVDIYHPAKFHPNRIKGFVSAHTRFRASNCLLGYLFIFSEREFTFTFALCYRRSVCLSSVTFVGPTQPVEIIGNFSSPFGTLAIR